MLTATSIFKLTSAIAIGILAFGTASFNASPITTPTEDVAHDTLVTRNSAMTGLNRILQRDSYHGVAVRDDEADLLSDKRRGKGKTGHAEPEGTDGNEGYADLFTSCIMLCIFTQFFFSSADATDSAAPPDATTSAAGYVILH